MTREPRRALARSSVPTTWPVVGASLVAACSISWTWREGGEYLISDWLLVLLGAGVLGLLLWHVRSLTLLASTLLALGGGVAITQTGRDTFSLWSTATVLLTLACYRPDLRLSRWGAVPVVAAAAGGLLWHWRNNPSDVPVSLVPVAGACVLIVVIEVSRWACARLATLRREAATARELAEANADLARRADLARDLHDSLGHHLTAIVVQAEAGLVGGHTRALAVISEAGRDALSDLEDVLFGLRVGTTPIVPSPLQRITSHLLPAVRASGLSVTSSIATSAHDPVLLAAAYRIVQESLTNVLKHAGANAVDVQVFDEGQVLVVQISDDGAGTDPSTTGSGIAGMRRRAEQLGGTFTCTGGQGNSIEARLPRGDQ